MKPDKSNKNYILHLLIISLWVIFILNIYFPWSIGLFIGGLLTAIIYIYYLYVTQGKNDKVQEFEKTIMSKLPNPLVVIDLTGKIVWHNPTFKEILKWQGFLTGKINHYLPGIQFKKNSNFSKLLTEQIAVKNIMYRADLLQYDEEYRILYLEEIKEKNLTEQEDLSQRPVIGIIQIDNFFEVMETFEEEKPLVLADIDKAISDWAIERDGYIRKYTEDKYLVFLTNQSLRQGEESKFAILDQIRSTDYGKNPVTISMGFGILEESLIDLGRLAHLALELALGRGGDQVVVKSPEKVWFYGGSSKALEKRTKVKARVIAHSLREMILEAEDVFIMGHEGADYDSIGSALGMAAAVKNFGKEPMIVIDRPNSSLEKLLSIVDQSEIPGSIIQPGEGKIKANKASLVIVVDTHKPSLVVDSALLEKADKIAVIDHHRRAEEFIENASLTYLEPYASSASELVTEIMQYLGDEFEMGSLEATALLAGITVDTKNFIYQTGARTFDAASYLRRIGADPVMVQQLLREDYAQVVKKAIIIENSQIIKEGIALGVYPDPVEEPQLLAAQGADEILNINGVRASFVICPTIQGGVVISARSAGEINVQVLMEKIDGGGHLTVAGAQLKSITLNEAKEKIINLIDENYEEVMV